mgnify:CR=1 FL=1
MAMRLDEVVSGIKADVALKIFGDDAHTLEQLAERVVREGIEPQPRSGRQEYLENIVNRYV